MKKKNNAHKVIGTWNSYQLISKCGSVLMKKVLTQYHHKIQSKLKEKKINLDFNGFSQYINAYLKYTLHHCLSSIIQTESLQDLCDFHCG